MFAGGILGATVTAAPLVRLAWLHPLGPGLGNANPAWLLQLAFTTAGGILIASYIGGAVAATHAESIARKSQAQALQVDAAERPGRLGP